MSDKKSKEKKTLNIWVAIPEILSRRLLRRDFGPVQRLWPRGGLWRWWKLTQTKTFSTVTTKWWSRRRRTMFYTTCHTLKQVKQNATNNLAPFFKSAFNALSDGVVRFAHCVAP